MIRFNQVSSCTQKLFLVVVLSFVVLPACSALQPQAQSVSSGISPISGSRPTLQGGEGQGEDDIAKSVLDGSDRRGASPLDLLDNPQVKKELGITDEQSARIEQVRLKQSEASRHISASFNLERLDAQQREQKLLQMSELRQKQSQIGQRAVANILKPEQLKRLKEITLQLYGWGILTSSQFIQELQLTPVQQQQLIDLNKQVLRQVNENWPNPNGNTPEAKQVTREIYRQNMDRITRQSNQQAFAILTPEQQQTLETLKGKKFELDSSKLPTSGPSPPPS